MTTAGGISVFAPRTGLMAHAEGRFGCRLWAVEGPDVFELDRDGTAYGFVQRGPAALVLGELTYPLTTGQYFSIPTVKRATSGGPARPIGDSVHRQAPRGKAGSSAFARAEGLAGLIRGTTDSLVVGVSQTSADGFFQLGGPIESAGRLRYIDGCTDSLLIAPVMMGDPCLNLLHIPPGTAQSAHTHPSFRAGIIAAGRGRCRTEAGETALEAGLMFVIPDGMVHSFHTADEALLVIAFHPDSDFGPTHETHPMINRTIPVAP